MTLLDDYKAHEKFKHAVLPKTGLKFREFVLGYALIMELLLGEMHPLVKAVQPLVDQVDELATRLSQRGPKSFERFLYGAHSRLDMYFEKLMGPEGCTDRLLPNLESYAHSILHGDPLPDTPWLSLDKTPLVLDTEEERSSKKKRDQANTAKNPDLRNEHKTQGRVAQVIERLGAPPNHDDGGEMCIIFHTKPQGCKHTCEHKHSHRRLTANEVTKLTHYLNPSTVICAVVAPGILFVSQHK